ncbi:hypothetical protein K4F52_002299 [Lecanicillium sp. MT-2017a]|nr:hypothetical protein K4F52_002299 [Lecanicillium sp. MT-2017a]
MKSEIPLQGDAIPSTPPHGIRAEDGLRELLAVYTSRPVSRALRKTFEYLNQQGNMGGRKPVALGPGTSAMTIDNFIPDRAFYEAGAVNAANRLPGDIKPSWKWRSAYRTYTYDARLERDFRKVIAQINFYMEQHNTRYGFILTDLELVAVKRIGKGHVAISKSIPWTAGEAMAGETAEGMTVLLGLWYLGMLASQENGYKFA